ncbi:MAG: hypothetical protein V4492_03550 [Chlamydiota bacterium]
MCDDVNVNSFQQLRKAELHLHLGGSYPKEYLLSIATQEQKDQLEKELDAIAKGVSYCDVFAVFQLVGKIINSEEKVQEGVQQLCFELQKDYVDYVEIRTGLKDLGQGREAYLKAVLAGIQASKSPQFDAKVYLSLQRNSSAESVRETIHLALKYRELGVIGIDISGDSTVGAIDEIMPILIEGEKAGLAFVVHMGESPEESDQMLLLQMLHPIRIGHAVHLSREAREWIMKERIPVEVCLSSSVLAGMISDFAAHPGFEMCRSGHPIVFCSDDPLIFSTDLSRELQLAQQYGRFDRGEIEAIVHDALMFRP